MQFFGLYMWHCENGDKLYKWRDCVLHTPQHQWHNGSI